MGSKILLADDSITIQKVVNLTFADEGIEVVTVSNGEMAERRIGEINPDLVLADIFMPGKNGYELCQFVKESPQFRNVPVVLLVGAFEPFDQTEARRVKADAHLTKPFESRTLVETVRKLIQSSRSNSASATSKPLQPRAVPDTRPLSPTFAEAASPFNLDFAATDDAAPIQPSVDGHSETPAVAFNENDLRATSESLSPEDNPVWRAGEDVASTNGDSAPQQSGTEAPPAFRFEEAEPQKAFGQGEPISSPINLSDAQGFEINALASPPQGQNELPSSQVPVSAEPESQSFAISSDEPAASSVSGFSVPSSFDGVGQNSVIDFNTVMSPEPPRPADVISVDLEGSKQEAGPVVSLGEISADNYSGESEFSVVSVQPGSSEPPAAEPEHFGRWETVDSEIKDSAASWSGTPQSFNEGAAFEAVEQTTSFAVVDSPSQSAPVNAEDEPLGDVFSDEKARPFGRPEAAAPIEFAEAGSNPTLEFQFQGPAGGSNPEPADAWPASDHPGQSDATFFEISENAGERSASLAPSSDKASLFEAVTAESKYPIGEGALGFSVVSQDEPVEMASSKFTASEMWGGGETRFSPIDVGAGPVEATAGAASASTDSSILSEALLQVETPDSQQFKSESALGETGFELSTPTMGESGFDIVQASSAAGAANEEEPRPKGSATSQPAAGGLDLSSEAVDEIVRRVVREITDAVVREVAWEVVPDCVERVVDKLARESLTKQA